jgi:hypothetical protein
MMLPRLTLLAAVAGFAFSAPAFADTYQTADFTFGVFGGNANQQPPFQNVVAPYPAGGSFTGSLVLDESLVPGPASGLVNVFFWQYPDIAQISPATALNIPLGNLPAFTLADAVGSDFSQQAAAQFNNGVFSGLFYISDFEYGGNPYQLQIHGGSLSIVPIVDGQPTFNRLVNGFVNGGLSNFQPYAVSAVPEPTTWAMLLIGFAGLGFAGYRTARRSVSIVE